MFWFDISGPKSYPFCPKLAQNAPLFAGLDRPANGTQKGPLSRYFVYDMVTIEQIESAPHRAVVSISVIYLSYICHISCPISV